MIRDKRLAKIKEEVLDYALDLWELEDERQLDPVVNLLLDAFAYEAYKLRLETEKSDSQILSRLSRILVGAKWYLSFPAHGLLTVYPQEGESGVQLQPEDHFSAESPRQGDKGEQFFFTPLGTHPLIDARISYILGGTQLRVSRRRRTEYIDFLDNIHRIEDYTLWIGLKVSSLQLTRLKALPLCLLPEDGRLAPLLRGVCVYDANGTSLPVHPYIFQGEGEEDHYAEEINGYYRDYYYQVEIPSNISLKTLSELFSYGDFEQDVDVDTPLWWLRIVFPPHFTQEALTNLRVHINTYPVVNRQLSVRHHNFSNSGRIIPLACHKNNHFLNVHSLQDNAGNNYINRLKQYEVYAKGVFSLYFGDLERFDTADAQTQIRKVLQLIREEGNAFAAINTEGVSAQLKELFEKLETAEKGTYKFRELGEQVKAFLLTTPQEEATHAELKYWQCQGDLANGISPQNTVNQFNTNKFLPSGIRFQTTTLQGTLHQEQHDLIQSLRYGLLSRERIVSREDVKSYIRHRLGECVQSIDIADGVAISKDLSKGIVRTTEVHIKTSMQFNTSEQCQVHMSHLAHFLEEELTKKSVSHTIYKIHFV